MAQIRLVVNVVAGVGSAAINARFAQKRACIVFTGVGTPAYDYYTLDNYANAIGGKTGASGNYTDVVELAEVPSGSFQIINATISGIYNVTITSELNPKMRVDR